MAAEFEKLAQDQAEKWKRHGYTVQADALISFARLISKSGMPEVFPDRAARSNLREQPREELLDIREIRAKIVQALSKVSPEKVFSQTPKTVANQMLSEAVGKQINLEVGQFIADEVRISDLVLLSSRRSLENTGFEGINQVDERVRHSYRNSVARLQKHTIGKVRNASFDEMSLWKGIGDTTAYFAKTAFARPQPPERQA